MSASPPLVLEITPPAVMTAVRAFQGWPDLLLLDSAATGTPRGRYSFLTADPRQRVVIAQPTYGTDPFALPRAWLQSTPPVLVDGLPPFQGGVAGLMGYELGRCWEQLPAAPIDDFGLPVFAAGLYDWVLAWDHHEGRAWWIVQDWPTAAGTATQRLTTLQQLLQSQPTSVLPPSPAPCDQSLLAPGFPSEVAGVLSNFDRLAYLHAVERVMEYIRAGDIFQANLTQRLLAPAPCGPIELYERLRRHNPAPFAGLYCRDDWAIVSASPERYLHVDGGRVVTRPIKGTRRRSAAPEADLFTRDELRESEKDQAENVMIVDLLRNDLSRVCRAGSVHVPQLCTVETYATVQHLVSEVGGQLRPGVTVWDLFAVASPGGSITGAPKIRAMQIIAELEPTVRGPYTGSLFYVSGSGRADSNLLIRTFVQRHGWLTCGVGGGITAQSDPEDEYAETWHKASGMLRALTDGGAA